MNFLKQFASINRFISAGYNVQLCYDPIQSHEQFSRTLPCIYKSNLGNYKVNLSPYSTQIKFTQPASFVFHDIDHYYLNCKSSVPFVRYRGSYLGLDDFKLYRHESEPSFRLLIKHLLSAILPSIQITAEPLLVIPGDMKCGFYHWIHDFLPALIYFKRHITDFSSYKLFIPSVNFKYQYSSLQLLSIEPSRILQFKCSPFSQVCISGVNKFISPLSVPGNPTPFTINLLKSEFVENVLIRPPDTDSLPRKFFVIRKKVGNNSQRLAYSDCAIKKLINFGYSPVVLESLSFVDQCHLFANATSIISPHGAGLSLLFLTSEKSTIVEIQNSSFHNPCYWALSNVCNLNYTCYDCYQGNQVQLIDATDISNILEIIADL